MFGFSSLGLEFQITTAVQNYPDLKGRQDYRRNTNLSEPPEGRAISAYSRRLWTTTPKRPCYRQPDFEAWERWRNAGRSPVASLECDSRHTTGLGYKSMAAAQAAVVSSSSLETDRALVPETAGTGAATAATPPATAAAAAVAAAARTGSEARVSKAALATKLLSLSGVFAVHKPKGPTSAELLNRLKEKLLAGTAARVGTRLRRSPRERKPQSQ